MGTGTGGRAAAANGQSGAEAGHEGSRPVGSTAGVYEGRNGDGESPLPGLGMMMQRRGYGCG